MHATVIDTLRYANSLKDAGVDARQAEAMARAINDELGSGLATKDDADELRRELDRTTGELASEIERTANDLKRAIERNTSEPRSESKRATDQLRADIVRVGVKIDRLRCKLETRGRYMFLVLALIAALGLYDAVASHLALSTASPP